MTEVAEHTQPVVDRHDHGVVLGREPPRVVLRAAARGERAAVDPHHHRTVPGRTRRRRDVEVQAVLDRRTRLAQLRVLRADRRGHRGVPHALPRRGRLRITPPVLAHRRRGERNIAERAVRAGHRPRDQALVRADEFPVVRLSRRDDDHAGQRRRHHGHPGRDQSSLHAPLPHCCPQIRAGNPDQRRDLRVGADAVATGTRAHAIAAAKAAVSIRDICGIPPSGSNVSTAATGENR